MYFYLLMNKDFITIIRLHFLMLIIRTRILELTNTNQNPNQEV